MAETNDYGQHINMKELDLALKKLKVKIPSA
jgi:hypothetical protein